MSIEYRLTLAGELPLAEVAARILPDPAERPRPTDSGRVWTTTLYDQYGFLVTIYAGRNGYYDAQADDGAWEWQPESYVNISFDIAKDNPKRALPSMLTIVDRVLTSGDEDVALTLNGNWLLLTRTSGVVNKYNRAQWWDHYGFADHLLEG